MRDRQEQDQNNLQQSTAGGARQFLGCSHLSVPPILVGIMVSAMEPMMQLLSLPCIICWCCHHSKQSSAKTLFVPLECRATMEKLYIFLISQRMQSEYAHTKKE